MATTIIAVANQKGGVGKTTTAVSLAHALTLLNKGSLLVDFDPQGQCATALGLQPEAHVFRMLVVEDNPVQLVQSTGRTGLGLIAGNKKTGSAQLHLESERAPLSYIRDAFKPFYRMNGQAPRYIILDTAPSVGGIQERALWAADMVIIPCVLDFLAVNGVAQALKTMQLLHGQGWPGKLLGVLPTFYDERSRETQAILAELSAQFGEQVLPPVHRATVLRECAARGKTIFEYDGHSRAAEEYAALARRVVEVSA